MSYSPESYRALFPFLPSGKLWLNHAAISPLNIRTRQAIERYLLERSEGAIEDFPGIVGISKRAKQQIGRLINSPEDRIGFVSNTSDGLNILANGIEWKSGDRILLNDMEFPANVVPFLNLRRHGVEIDFVRCTDGEVRTEDIEAAITPRTKLISISFVQFFSGFKADLPAIGTICREKGIIFCVDAIQGVGSVPIDVAESRIDFLSCGGHKWLLTMMGIGFVYLTKEMQDRITQASVGWTSNKHYFTNLFDYRIDVEESARRYENGAQNSMGIVAMETSAALLNEIGVSTIHAHLLSLTERVFEFADTESITAVTPRDRDKRSGIVSLKLDNAEKIFESLTKKEFIVSLREGVIRISPHFYNTADDMDRLCAALKQELP